MENRLPKYPRVLAIAPSRTGFGYAFIEGHRTLVDWGTKQVKGEKNKESIKRVEKIIGCHKPQVVVLEDVWAKSSRRHTPIQRLVSMIMTLAKKEKIKTALFSRADVMKIFLPDKKTTKDNLAAAIALKYEELLPVLP